MCIHFEHFININSFHASDLLSPISACESVDCCSQHSVKQPNTRGRPPPPTFIAITVNAWLCEMGGGAFSVAICVRKIGNFYFFK